MRHSLSDKSTRVATVLGSWLEAPESLGIVPFHEIVQTFKSKSKRSKSKGKTVKVLNTDASSA